VYIIYLTDKSKSYEVWTYTVNILEPWEFEV